VLRYDQRGHGKSEAPAGRYTFDILIADALALMDAVGIACANFCGLSMGGATALGLAQRHPDRVERAIVCDSGCASTPQSAQQWEERIAVAQSAGMEPLVEPTIARWFPPNVVASNAPYLAKVRTMIRNTPANGFVGCAAALGDHDFRSAVASTKPPVLFIAGEKDAGGAVATAMKGLQQALPGSRYVELAGAGHISNLDDPAGFTGALRAFLA
jgi:3-oxoadipate enol-lactonase